MPDTPYISDPGWTCTITSGSATVTVSGVVPSLEFVAGDRLVGAGGGSLAIAAAGDATITLVRPAPAAEAGAGIPLVVERGLWRAMPAAAATISRDVYATQQMAKRDGRLRPVLARQDSPPSTPAHGDRYMVGTSPTGAWAGHANQIAEWSDVANAWLYETPQAGSVATIDGTATLGVWTGSAWIFAGPGDYVGKAGAQVMQGPLVVSEGGVIAPSSVITGPAGSYRFTHHRTGELPRIHAGITDDAESGSNEGSNYFVHRFADNGDYLGRPLEISRRYGYVRTPEQPKIVLLGNVTGAYTAAAEHELLWDAYVAQAEAFNMTWNGSLGRVTVIAPGRYVVSAQIVTVVDGLYPTAALDLNVNGGFVAQPIYVAEPMASKITTLSVLELQGGDYFTLSVPDWLTTGFRVGDGASYALRVSAYYLG